MYFPADNNYWQAASKILGCPLTIMRPQDVWKVVYQSSHVFNEIFSNSIKFLQLCLVTANGMKRIWSVIKDGLDVHNRNGKFEGSFNSVPCLMSANLLCFVTASEINPKRAEINPKKAVRTEVCSQIQAVAKPGKCMIENDWPSDWLKINKANRRWKLNSVISFNDYSLWFF